MAQPVAKTPVLVLTFATEETAYLPSLRASAKAQGFRFEVLGLNQKWQGFMWANSLLMDRVRECDPNELVLVLDGYDTLVVMSEKQMVIKYEEVCALATARADRSPDSPAGKWLVFGIEHSRDVSSWLYWNTMVRMAKRYHLVPPDVEYYLNTGAFLGPAKHVLTYMEETCKHAAATGNKDDQNTANSLFWGWWVHPDEPRVSRRDAPLPLALDTEGDLFYCHCERRLAFLLFGIAVRAHAAHERCRVDSCGWQAAAAVAALLRLPPSPPPSSRTLGSLRLAHGPPGLLVTALTRAAPTMWLLSGRALLLRSGVQTTSRQTTPALSSSRTAR